MSEKISIPGHGDGWEYHSKFSINGSAIGNDFIMLLRLKPAPLPEIKVGDTVCDGETMGHVSCLGLNCFYTVNQDLKTGQWDKDYFFKNSKFRIYRNGECIWKKE